MILINKSWDGDNLHEDLPHVTGSFLVNSFKDNVHTEAYGHDTVCFAESYARKYKLNTKIVSRL